ncbi:MAG: shikimate kinase [Planctomycetota bacterium]
MSGASERPLDRPVIALIGMRGSGKSTLGRLLSDALDLPFVDLDDETLIRGRRAGWRAASTGELLIQAGQARFRVLEAEALRRVCEPGQRLVLATGGGVVENSDSRAWLNRSAQVIWLDVPLEVLRARVSGDGIEARPSLTGGDPVAELGQVLARREPLYRSLADHVLAPLKMEPTAALELGLKMLQET